MLVRPHSHARLPQNERLSLVQGPLLDPDAVEKTIQGADSVCCLFGPRSPFSPLFCAEATRLIVNSMRENNVNRLICVTGALVGDFAANRTFPFQRMARAFKRKRPWPSKDREDQEQWVRDSGLDWTLVKPSRLSDGLRSADLKCGPRIRVGLFSHVSRRDLAALILREIREPEHLNKCVFVTG